MFSNALPFPLILFFAIIVMIKMMLFRDFAVDRLRPGVGNGGWS